ncbi:hypothetical protein AB0O86_36720 [Streptomyces hirsutus]|uniref:hypothetical protein n=1 Tax=Streptomyces hirsutus TaxID=35620 RepID=UPI0034163BB6
MHKGRQNSSDSAAPDDGPFRSWLRALSEELGTELEDFLDSEEVLAFLRSAFTRNGSMPAPYFVPLLCAHRQALAQRTVDALITQVRRDTGRRVEVPVHYETPSVREPEGAVRVGHEPVHGIDPVDIRIESAEGVQCLLADRDRLVWPLCPDHRVGLHAARTPSGATWVCSVTRHAVASISG